MLNGGHVEDGFTVNEKLPCTVCEPDAQLSLTLMVKLDVPAAIGVPEISPVGLNVTPDGRDPEMTVNVVGSWPPVASI